MHLLDQIFSKFYRGAFLTGIKVNFLNVYLFFFFLRERETVCEQGRGREREGDKESKAGSRLRAVSTEPNAGLELNEL